VFFTGGSDGYQEKPSKDRKEASVGEDLVRPVGEEGDTFFRNRVDAKDRCYPNNKCLIFWERMSVPIALEHYPFFPFSCRQYSIFDVIK
jgi:hypothetical protein